MPLCLMRKKGERIVMRLPDGGEIWVKVSELNPGRVYLMIDAPKDVKITREELLDKQPRVREIPPG